MYNLISWLLDYVTCDSFATSPNINVLYTDGGRVGSVASFECLPPTSLVGSSFARCRSNGTWSHSLPTCAGKYLDFLLCMKDISEYSRILQCINMEYKYKYGYVSVKKSIIKKNVFVFAINADNCNSIFFELHYIINLTLNLFYFAGKTNPKIRVNYFIFILHDAVKLADNLLQIFINSFRCAQY